MQKVLLSDRRYAPRKRVAIDVEERGPDALYFHRAANLSATGVFLEGTLPHPPETAVALTLHLPQGPREMEGVVVQTDARRPGMAVRFVDLTQRQRADLLWALK